VDEEVSELVCDVDAVEDAGSSDEIGVGLASEEAADAEVSAWVGSVNGVEKSVPATSMAVFCPVFRTAAALSSSAVAPYSRNDVNSAPVYVIVVVGVALASATLAHINIALPMSTRTQRRVRIVEKVVRFSVKELLNTRPTPSIAS
jgi:hypothetical protein